MSMESGAMCIPQQRCRLYAGESRWCVSRTAYGDRRAGISSQSGCRHRPKHAYKRDQIIMHDMSVAVIVG